MEEQIRVLRDQIAMSSSGSEEQQEKLKSQIGEVDADRDRLQEELRKLKEGMKAENEEIARKNAELKKRLEQEKKVPYHAFLFDETKFVCFFFFLLSNLCRFSSFSYSLDSSHLIRIAMLSSCTCRKCKKRKARLSSYSTATSASI
jgi:DNA repair exonuclease SbcCD ATPase subunit